ncbi:hypothetical protein NX801_18100 [Streptomyces sp. LP05-1]|uniref:Uncharacterized protein n=1 Tax=Streptomyces pyxinae TaxID=2970734 RepID=A0ABT2CJE8_9ACTN|nr:hypothetical protein [Streptomyces sp. LP05-1]MCS0637543.1 hypothetical protein [Streptomyces sp. LP05-1]
MLVLDKGGNGSQLAFAETRFGARRHRVHIRGVRQLQGRVEDTSGVNIVTGVCLFSTGSLRAWGPRGRPVNLLENKAAHIADRVDEFTVEDDLSLYEYESLVQHVAVTADLVAALPGSVPVTITIDIPRVQYYLYLNDRLLKRLVSPELAQRWYEEVDTRHARVTALFHTRLSAALAGVGRPDVRVRQAAGLEPLAGPLRSAVRHGGVPDHEELLNQLLATGDPVWPLADKLAQPDNHRELVRTSYVVEYLRAVGLPDTDVPGPVAVAIDTYFEMPILKRARQLIDALGGSASARPIVGLYPVEGLLRLDDAGVPGKPYACDRGRYAATDTDAHTRTDLFSVVDALHA